MCYVAPILLIFSLVMACLTDPQGFAVWVSKDQVTSVSRNVDGVPAAQTKVSTTSGPVYVREPVADVIKKLNGEQP